MSTLPSTRKILGVTLLALGLAFAGRPAAASHQETTLGNDGELYVIRGGNYGDLFPGGTATERDSPVLALDIVKPGSPTDRRLIPSTQGKDVESTPAAIFEDDSSTLFVIWESRINSIHSIFRLASFDGAAWSNPIDITGNPFSVKTPPQIAVTRDAYGVREADNGVSIHHRYVLHVAWSEENAAGLYDAYYTPIIVDEGAYLGWNPVYRLDDFDNWDTTTVAASASPASELVKAPTLQPGRDGQTLVAAFASSATGRMAAVEIDVLPTQLQRLADKARAFIVDLGVRRKITDLNVLSARSRTFLLDNGIDYQPEVARSIADQVATYVQTNGGVGGVLGPGGIQNIASGARAFIVDLGAKFSGRGLKSNAVESASTVAPRTLEIAAEQGDTSRPAAHIFQVRSGSSRRSPEIGAGAVRVFASETGGEILISWAAPDKVTYRISQGDGWSETHEIRLSDSLDLNGAYEILAQRVRRR